jgi:hypothetical protein
MRSYGQLAIGQYTGLCNIGHPGLTWRIQHRAYLKAKLPTSANPPASESLWHHDEKPTSVGSIAQETDRLVSFLY